MKTDARTESIYPNMVTQKEEAEMKDLKTVISELSVMIDELQVASPSEFQSKFIQLVVFIATDLNKVLASENDNYRPSMGKILKDAVGKISKKYTTQDLQQAEIKEKVLPLVSEGMNLLSLERMSVDDVRGFLEKWSALGINVE